MNKKIHINGMIDMHKTHCNILDFKRLGFNCFKFEKNEDNAQNIL